MLRSLLMLGVVALGALIAGPAGAAGAKIGKMKLTSEDIKPGATIKDEQVFNAAGCTGSNISPQLAWSGAPATAKSLALTVYDPDAPTGSGFWHWVDFNIPAGTTSLPKNAGDPKANLMPAGAVQSRTDWSLMAYGGPCPPKGDKAHHYIFTIYAVDVDHLDADANASAAVIGFNLHYHTLAKGTLVGRYGR